MSQCTDISTSSSSVSVMPGPEMLKNGFVGLCQQNASLQTAACKSKPLMETGRWRHPGQAGFKVAPGMCCFASLQTFSVLQPPGPKKVQTNIDQFYEAKKLKGLLLALKTLKT